MLYSCVALYLGHRCMKSIEELAWLLQREVPLRGWSRPSLIFVVVDVSGQFDQEGKVRIDSQRITCICEYVARASNHTELMPSSTKSLPPDAQAYSLPCVLGHETTLRRGYPGCFDYVPLLGCPIWMGTHTLCTNWCHRSTVFHPCTVC